MTATISKTIAARIVNLAHVPAHEGPVWCPAEQTLFYTTMPVRGVDGMPHIRIDALRLEGLNLRQLTGPVGAGRVRTLVRDANAANGMCSDGSGGLLVCEQGSLTRPARIGRFDCRTGAHDVVVDALDGAALNSPNDIVLHRDGSIWFTDPSYGWLQGFRPRPAIPDGVHRYDPGTGQHDIVTALFDKPNGLAFAADHTMLYVGDSGANHEPGSYDARRPHRVAAIKIGASSVRGERWSVTVDPGYPDGLKVDSSGRVWCTTGNGLRAYTPDGDPIGDVTIPGAVNFTFTDTDDVLLVTADTAIHVVVLEPLP